MPSRVSHQSIAFLTMFFGQSIAELQDGELTAKPLVGAAIAAVATNLPDLIEPANNPHHRQFFHSIALGSLVASVGIKVYRWQPEDDWGKILRQALLLGCGGYLIHLVADSLTPRGLPLIGKV